MLVDYEIEKMGMGKYQKCLWVLCGLGYFLGYYCHILQKLSGLTFSDLLWAMMGGLILQVRQYSP